MNFAPIHQQCSLHQISQQVPYTLNGKKQGNVWSVFAVKVKVKVDVAVH